ncbi:cupin domain-containing protein [Pedobacter sp. L105]|uniref:cupin domain-containing protein n=1 Tax=Pedobacter sp. L105 TaxID=1641871 RepID=UPI00131E7F32|nr:cupin domain-containing protein [Pedobacter sp. L105]
MKNTFWLLGAKLTITLDDILTGSGYDVITGIFAPCSEVPLHLHTAYSETIIVLEGEQTIYTPGSEAVLKPGDHLFIPAGTPHAIVSSGLQQSKALTIASPGGFAKLIRTAGIPVNTDGSTPDKPFDMPLFMKVSAELGDQLLGPPVTRP